MIRIFFGNIGSGKTTLAVRNARKILKKAKRLKPGSRRARAFPYRYIYSNFYSSVTRHCDLKDLGDWTFPPKSYVLIDEAGIEYNNRKFKSLPQKTIEWFKLSRHYKCDVDVFSQSWEDMDVTLRRLASELWYIRKVGPFTMLRRIYKTVEVDETTHQIIDGYSFGKLWHQFAPPPFHRTEIKIFLRRPYYKYFDSYSVPDTPIRT